MDFISSNTNMYDFAVPNVDVHFTKQQATFSNDHLTSHFKQCNTDPSTSDAKSFEIDVSPSSTTPNQMGNIPSKADDVVNEREPRNAAQLQNCDSASEPELCNKRSLKEIETEDLLVAPKQNSTDDSVRRGVEPAEDVSAKKATSHNTQDSIHHVTISAKVATSDKIICSKDFHAFVSRHLI